MTYQQQRLGQYDYYEVLSAFRKEIVLGRTEDAIFWLTVLLTYSQSGAKTAARQLWIIAAEVVDDDACVLRAFAVYQMTGKVTETDHLYYLTAKMCRSPKWFETAEGVSVDYLWSKSIGDLKKAPKPIPSYARDEHTAIGARAKKPGVASTTAFRDTITADSRLNGCMSITDLLAPILTQATSFSYTTSSTKTSWANRMNQYSSHC